MKIRTLGATLLLGASALALAGPASAGADLCGTRANNSVDKFIDCVTVDGVIGHLQALQDIADAEGGNRASGYPGFDASVDYIVAQLTAAGYDPVVQPFDFVVYNETAASIFSRDGVPFVEDFQTPPGDFYTMSYSGSGDVTGIIEPIADISLGLGNESTSGCEAEDFAGFTAGNIALIQRGACTFQQKAENAIDAGATAVIIFNQGNSADRTDVVAGTLSSDFVGDVPVIGLTYDLGVEFINSAEPVEVRLFTQTTRDPYTTANVLAETKGGNDKTVLMVGAHLDSVGEGPGIQDNGSGSAVILETALQLANTPLKNKVRFAWWGAEEAGLVGSNYYVDNLIDQYFDAGNEDALKIAAYLNFDMVASPNYVFKIYDGDDSDAEGAGPGPEGSAAIEAFFEDYYARLGQPFKGTDFSGRSDYGPFIDSLGVPAGGLFTGAEELKSAEEAAIWGGTAGIALDRCYHSDCDTIENVSVEALEVNTEVVAASVIWFAQNLSAVNGSKAKGNFKSFGKAFDGPGMTGMDLLAHEAQK